MNLKKLVLFIGLIISLTLSPFLRVTANDTITLPNKCIEGRLTNGLRYFIMNNDTPAKRVEFRLVMSVGANHENDNQRGAAHYLEHMAFGGTEKFPNNEAVTYLESLGMKYGRDINAMTGYDKTIYIFGAPVGGDMTIVDNSLLILKEWLTTITIADEAVESERGIIFEELRGSSLGDDFYDLKIGNNIFSKRLPLGSVDDIRAITPKTLKDFYNKWYAPNLACIIVVGDIDPEKIEAKIKKAFNSIPSKEITETIYHPLTYAKGIQIKQITDTLVQRQKLDVMIPHKSIVANTKSNFYKSSLERMLISSLRVRFKQVEDVDVSFFDSWYLSTTSHFGFTLQSKNSKETLAGIESITHEFANILEHGFLKEEVEQVKEEMIERLENRTFDKSSTVWCDDFIDCFITGDRYISTSQDNEWLISKIKASKPSDLTPMLKERVDLWRENILIALLNNKSKGKTITSETFKASWEKGLKASPIKREWTSSPISIEEEAIVKAPILERKHQFDTSHIASIRKYPDMGVSEYTLTNGIVLILKPTPKDTEKKVMITSTTPGGRAWIAPEKFHQFEDFAGYMELGGIAKLDYDTWSDYMVQENLSLILTSENHWHGLMGSSPSDKSNLLFNLIYQKITAPELPYGDFKDIKKDLLSNINTETGLDKMLKRSPDRLLLARTRELMGESIGDLYPDMTKEDIESLDLDDIADYYKRLYATTENSVYIITGNYDIDTISQNFISVFGKMPKDSLPLELKCPEFKFPTRNIIEGFDIENKSQTVLNCIYYGNLEQSLKGSLIVKLMRDLLQNRLLAILREQESLVYSPYVFLNYSGVPYKKYYIEINTSMEKTNAAKATKIIDQIFNNLAFQEVSEDELNILKRSFLVTKSEALNDDATSKWRDALTAVIKNGQTLEDYEKYQYALNNITPKDIQEHFSELINNERIILYQGEYINESLEQKPAYKLYDNRAYEVNFNTMIDSLAKNDVIFLGEYHDCSIAHWLQFEILKSLSHHFDNKLSLGLEMLESDNQLIVDEYIKGFISEERFLAETRLWNNYKSDYSPMVNFAKDNSIPVVATNIPRRYARMVSEDGLEALDSLPEEARRYLEDGVALVKSMKPEMANSEMFSMMKGMVDNDKLTRLTHAQSIKDAIMAKNIAHNLANNINNHFVHINGNLHSEKNSGIIPFLLKKNPKLRIVNIKTIYQDDISFIESEYSNGADFYIVVPSNTHRSY